MAIDVQCKHVGFRYAAKGPWVLEDFSFTCSPGITAIQGYSGSGKSTLLRLLAGYLKPSRGEVIVWPMMRAPTREFHRRELGFVFQDQNLLRRASVERNLWVGSSLAGLSRKAFAAACDDWLDRLQLSEKRHARPKHLSGGQKQRVALARALIKGAGVLLLDEPTTGLDQGNRQIVFNAVKEAAMRGTTCVIATHEPDVTEIADQTVAVGEPVQAPSAVMA
jgi:ABC-type lipoprotein export system ATPase subunit